MEVSNPVEYKIAWTDRIEDGFYRDFLFVENQVFDGKMSPENYQKKYSDNIYGPSVLVIAYINGNPVGADALWRNDIDGKKAYQSADTCVLPAARGKGVFMGMVTKKLEAVRENVIVYGFPNINSSHGFLKSGWHLVDESYTTVLLCSRRLLDNISYHIDRRYAEWWYAGHEILYSLNKQGRWWLAAKRKPFLFSIIGELSEDAATLFPRIKGVNLFLYKSHHKAFYNKNRTPMRTIISPSTPECKIPTWKLDSI